MELQKNTSRTDCILFSSQVFDSKESLSTAAECVKVAKEHCQQLTEIGVDLTFTLQSLLVKDVKAALLSYKDIIMEATKHRNSEEMWRRMNLMTPEALAKLKVHVVVGFFFPNILDRKNKMYLILFMENEHV